MAGRFFDAWADSPRGCLPDNEEMSPPARERSSMIVSVSRRTDIPAFYADWFFRRLEEGFALVRNPVNPRRVSRVNLSPDATDGFVFWTKNPSPMLNRLSRLRDYAYYFQVTLNAYGRDAEPGVPSKRDVIIPAFRRLSELAGRERVIWRYDPVFFSAAYTMEHHVRYFERLAALLAPWTEKCIVSFLDVYRNTRRNMASLGLRDASMEERRGACVGLGGDCPIARSHAGSLCGRHGFGRILHRTRPLRGCRTARQAARRDAEGEEGSESAPGLRLCGERGHRRLRQLSSRLPLLLRLHRTIGRARGGGQARSLLAVSRGAR